MIPLWLSAINFVFKVMNKDEAISSALNCKVLPFKINSYAVNNYVFNISHLRLKVLTWGAMLGFFFFFCVRFVNAPSVFNQAPRFFNRCVNYLIIRSESNFGFIISNATAIFLAFPRTDIGKEWNWKSSSSVSDHVQSSKGTFPRIARTLKLQKLYRWTVNGKYL